MTENNGIEDLRSQLRSLRAGSTSGKSSFLSKFKDRISAVENLRLVGVVVGIVGATAAAIARGIEGDLGLGIAIAGAVSAAVAGGFVALMDRKKLDISNEAADANERLDQALTLSDTAIESIDRLAKLTQAFDRKRRERLAAIERMIAVMEALLISKSNDVKASAEMLLSRAIQPIRASVDFQGDDFFTVTIFQKSQTASGEEMVPIAAEWTDPDLARKGGRSWKIGEGYTGMAWQNATTNPNGDVILADTSKADIQSQYPVRSANPEREKLYRSVAAIPILINARNDVWGVVTATSSRCGVFQRDPENIKVQNVDVIRDIARVAALLAGLENGNK